MSSCIFYNAFATEWPLVYWKPFWHFADLGILILGFKNNEGLKEGLLEIRVS